MIRTSFLLLLLLWTGTGALLGQAKAQAQPGPQRGFDSFLMLVAPRDTITIRRQLRTAIEAKAQAESRRQQAETMRLGARGRIEAKKVEMVRIKERIALAKKENVELVLCVGGGSVDTPTPGSAGTGPSGTGTAGTGTSAGTGGQGTAGSSASG